MQISGWLKERMYGDQMIIQGMRISLYVILSVLALVSFLSSDFFYNWELNRDFYYTAGFGLFIAIAGLLTPGDIFRKNKVLLVSFVMDVLLIGFLVYRNHLNATLLFFCCLLLIMAAGLAFGKSGAIAGALIASIGTSSSLMLGPELKTLNFFFQLLLSNIGFFMVALLSGYFAEQLRAQGYSLLSLKEMNQLIVDGLPVGILTVLPSGQVLQSNPGSAALFGRKEEDLQNVREFFPELGELKARKEDLIVPRDGENQYWRLQVVPKRVGPQETFIVLLEDLTQVKKLEFGMQQSEKLAAVGQLAAGIAHEIRNPLTGISGSIELLSQHSQTEDDRKLSKIILKEIDRLNNLITEFLDFAKPEKPPVEVIDLNQLLKESVDALKLDKILRGEVVHWEWEGQPGARIRANRDKLKQALFNILVNALQAMEGREAPKIRVSTHLKSDAVEIQIRDNGCGMSEQTRQKMFEPFHTTKSRGTGLGLAITLKIIESHQGKIFVESKAGEGTTFSIVLPKA